MPHGMRTSGITLPKLFSAVIVFGKRNSNVTCRKDP